MKWKRLIDLPGRSARSIARDVDDELAFHLKAREEELLASGLSADDARRRALQDFGDVDEARAYATAIDQRTHSTRRRRDYLGELRQDVVYAIRRLRSAPGFTLAAVATLALGIGATTGIFSVVNSVLLRPLPYPDPGQLYRVWSANQTAGNLQGGVSAMDIDDWRAQREQIADLGGYWFQPGASGLDLSGEGEPQRLTAVFVTPGFYPALGVQPQLGRLPREDELVRGGPDRGLVLTHAFWQRHFNGRPDVIGQSLRVNGEPFAVLGVLPPSMVVPTAGADVFASFSLFTDDQVPRRRFVRTLGVVARAKAGVSATAVTAELQTIAQRLAARYPENASWDGATVESLRSSITGEASRSLWVLLGAVATLLLIACVNVASLQLARASAREGEVATRAALGATRSRLVRQLLTESVVLSLVGGLLGIGVAVAVARGITWLAADQLPRGSEVVIDAPVLGFAVALSIVTGIAFGLFPAWRAARDLQSPMRGERGSTGSHRSTLRHALVVTEVALAMVLVIAGGLMARSFRALHDVDLGFRSDNVLVMNYTLSTERHGDNYQQIYARILERVRALPGVEAAGAVKDAPFRGAGERIGFRLPEMVVPSGEDGPTAAMLNVSDGFFKAIGAQLVAGREFVETDRADAPPVVVVNEAFARHWFPEGEAVGKRLISFLTTPIEIVGVVKDIRQTEVASDAVETVYLHVQQVGRVRMNLIVRTKGDPMAMAGAVRSAIHEIDPLQAITDTFTMDDVVGQALARPRLVTTLLGSFGIAGLILGALGLYGVLAYLVEQRRRDIGVRLALGAPRQRVLQQVVGQGMRLAAIGVVLGAAAAFAVSRVLSSVLFGVSPTDPLTYVVVSLVLLVVAWLASLIPARRAASVDVVRTLRTS